MKILLSSHFFAPSVGGIQEVSEILAAEFTRSGEDVVVVTQTSEDTAVAPSFEVVRKPSPARLLSLVRWCDVLFQNNISLQTAWPLLFCRRPWVVAHHSWIRRGDGRIGVRDRLKLSLLRKARRNIAVSRALADGLGLDCTVIGNPYRDGIFQNEGLVRDRDVIFLGRFTPDKGAHVLLAALRELAQRGVRLSATLIGTGPEEKSLRNAAEGLDVQFPGTNSREEIANALNRHRILVVPSTIEEPFGIAALEGIACGCMVIGSNAGGLPDAIGPCGVTFEHGNSGELASMLERNWPISEFQAHAAGHLARHRAPVVAAAYLKVLREAVSC